MKKIFNNILIGLFMLTIVSSCKDSVEDLSKITYFVELTLEGGNQMGVEINTNYVDPGYTATEGDEDVTDKVVISGEVNTSQLGFYPLTYSATNKDGFTISTTRNVFVYDPDVATDYSGTYTVEGIRTANGATESFTDCTITITRLYPGLYSVSDFLGGYYAEHRGYGNSYALKGYASIGNDNVISGLYSYIAGWGDSATSINGTVKEDNTLSMTTVYAGMNFDVKLTKQN